jgi:WD40 repeat protein
VVIYDIIYLSGREMYCYSSSDHCMTVCKEFSSMGGKKVNFQQHSRFYHNLLHLKLCWSAKHDLLCSVASDRVIYGWNIDTGAILFQVSRHTDIITDFIACDHLDMFMTCSMDKRIVLWSAVSRRVKGILLGHKRGVRNLSVFDQTLLSAGFECEARLWELVNKDCIAILKGHRHPIVSAQLMCDKAQSEKEYRAITVDESGEFRLWNIYIRERSSEPVLLPTLQIFEMTHPEVPINQFRFLAVPYNPNASTSYYSDFIACSTKLLHFIPEKNVKEFVAPSACVFNEAGSSVITAYGKTLIQYDVSSGEFSNVFEDMCSHEISALCLDGERGRKMYVGTSIGELLLVNTTTGMVIDSVHYHSKEITSLCEKNKGRACVYR